MYNPVRDGVIKLHKGRDERKAMYNQSEIGYKIVEDYVHSQQSWECKIATGK